MAGIYPEPPPSVINTADLDNLQQRLEQSTATRKLIVTDGVFSMDGDLAPLKETQCLAAKA